jgi:hypothetical protein
VARARERDTALLCLSGKPSRAALLACDQIVTVGGRLALHADFDIAGLGIVRQLQSRYEDRAAAWRMDADDYRRAVVGSTVDLDPTHIPDTPWSPPLADAMRIHARAAFEEALIDTLLSDSQN